MTIALEFSRPIKATEIPAAGLQRQISATEQECAALAERFGLLALSSFVAEIRLKPKPGMLIDCGGTLSAKVTQACVLTLAPVEAEINDDFQTVFTSDPTAHEPTPEEIEADESLLDAPEPLMNGMIDLGELAAQYLSLAIDPRPVADGADWPESGVGDAPVSPFAVLVNKDK